MAGEWRRTTLDQLGRIVTGKTPPSSVSNAFGGEIPFVTPSDMDGSRTIKHTARTLTESGAAVVSGARVPANAVMVSCIGSDMGKAAIAGIDCVTNQQINSIIIKTEDSPLYVYYDLSIRKAEIRGAASGSAQPILNKSAFGRFEIELPPPDEQRAIAHILGTLDDKIELNRRMNETLEAIARTIFKSWFVDFDPVRAKASGEAPESICRRLGLTPDLLALFPDRLVDSELGEIPAGWHVQPLVQLSEKISKGTTPTKQDIARATDVPSVSFIKVKDINDRGEVIRDGLELIPESVHSGVLKRSILVAGDILFSIAGTIGRIAVVEPELANSNTNQAVAFVRLKDNAAHLGLCLQHLQSDRIQEAATASVVQAVQANVSLASLGAFKIVVPEAGVLELWNQIFGGIFNKTRICAAESRTLAAVRDTLIPKLLSGEIRTTRLELEYA